LKSKKSSPFGEGLGKALSVYLPLNSEIIQAIMAIIIIMAIIPTMAPALKITPIK
jgi:hypothetical protein